MNIRIIRLAGLVVRCPEFFCSVLNGRYLSEPENNCKCWFHSYLSLTRANDQQDGLRDVITDTAVVAGVTQLQTGDVEAGGGDWPLPQSLQAASLPGPGRDDVLPQSPGEGERGADQPRDDTLELHPPACLGVEDGSASYCH